MGADLYGPISVRQGDLEVLQMSGLHDKLLALQQNDAMKFGLYGDNILYSRN